VPPTWEHRSFRSYITGDPVTKSQFFKEINKERILNTMNDLNKRKASYAVSKSKPMIKIKVLTGRPADKIIDFAEKLHVDLIIMGSNGKKGVSGFFRGLGSVSRKVAESVSCNVLIVR
jgi:nucleotide-binding universal stress UspA family protein